MVTYYVPTGTVTTIDTKKQQSVKDKAPPLDEAYRDHCDDEDEEEPRCCEDQNDAECSCPRDIRSTFFDFLPKCELNWIALGLAMITFGFAILSTGTLSSAFVQSAVLHAVGAESPFDLHLLKSGYILAFFSAFVTGVTGYFLYRCCTNEWSILISGSALAAAAFPVGQIGSLFTLLAGNLTANEPFSLYISVTLIVLFGLIGIFFLIAVYFYCPPKCASAERATMTGMTFISAGWAAGKLLIALTHLIELNEQGFDIGQFFYIYLAIGLLMVFLVIYHAFKLLRNRQCGPFARAVPFLSLVGMLANEVLVQLASRILPVAFATVGVTAQLNWVAFTAGGIAAYALVAAHGVADGSCAIIWEFLNASSALPLLYSIAHYIEVYTQLSDGTTIDNTLKMIAGVFLGAIFRFFWSVYWRTRVSSAVATFAAGLSAGIFGGAFVVLYGNSINDWIIPSTTVTSSLPVHIGTAVILGHAFAVWFLNEFIISDCFVAVVIGLSVSLLAFGSAQLFGFFAYNAILLSKEFGLLLQSALLYFAYSVVAIALPLAISECLGPCAVQLFAIASVGLGIAGAGLGRALGALSTVDYALPFFFVLATGISVPFIGQLSIWAFNEANQYTAALAIAFGVIGFGVFEHLNYSAQLFLDGQTWILSDFYRPWAYAVIFFVLALLLLQHKSFCVIDTCWYRYLILLPAFAISHWARFAPTNALQGLLQNTFLGAPIDLNAFSNLNHVVIILSSLLAGLGFLFGCLNLKWPDCLAYLAVSIAYYPVYYVLGYYRHYRPSFLEDEPFLTAIYRLTDFTSAAFTTASIKLGVLSFALFVVTLAIAVSVALKYAAERPSSRALGAALAVSSLGVSVTGIGATMAAFLFFINSAKFVAVPFTELLVPIAIFVLLPLPFVWLAVWYIGYACCFR